MCKVYFFKQAVIQAPFQSNCNRSLIRNVTDRKSQGVYTTDRFLQSIRYDKCTIPIEIVQKTSPIKIHKNIKTYLCIRKQRQ